MPEARAEISRDDIIAYARRRGEQVSSHQLVRWHKSGLLPRPRRRHRGRGLGTESLYPASAAQQTVEICRALRVSRDRHFVAWWLWSAGYEVPSLARDYLLSLVRALEEPSRESLDSLLDTDSEVFDTLLDRSTSGRPLAELGAVRRRTGKSRFPTFLRIGMDALLGRFQAEQYEREDLAIFEKGLSAVTRPPLKLDSLATLSRHANLPLIRKAIEGASASNLETARNELRAGLDFLGSISDTEFPLLPPVGFIAWYYVRFGHRVTRLLIAKGLSSLEWPAFRRDLFIQLGATTRGGET